jgi:molecular chaperone GrpE
MPDQYESQVSEVGKNQNEQSSADQFDAAEDNYQHAVPALVDDEDDKTNVFDLDTDSVSSLEDLIRRAGKFVSKKKPDPAQPVVTNAAAADTTNIDSAVGADGADEVAVLKAQLEQEKNNTLRALADLQNVRRRTDEERGRIIRDANERLIKELLPILDDFERGLGAARDNHSYDMLIDGVESVLRKTSDVLAKQGVIPIPSVGEQFNPDLHEAVTVSEGSDQPDESVIAELRKGYTLHGRVIRPSLVTVAKS